MTYRIEASFRRTMLLCGIFFGIVTAVFCAVLIFDRAEEAAADIGLLIGAVFCAALGAWSFRVYSNVERYTVETSDYGIRVGSGQAVPWLNIAAVRERRVGQRLDLFDGSGTKLAAVEYQLEHVEDLVREIRERSRIAESSPGSTVFGIRRATGDLVFGAVFIAAMSGLVVWLGITEGAWWLTALLPPFLIWAFYTELRDDVRQVEIRERDLAIRTFLRETIVARDSVADSDLVLIPAGMQRFLACAVLLRDGTLITLRSNGFDPVALTVAIRRWLPPGATGA